jgi:hypothetical protein
MIIDVPPNPTLAPVRPDARIGITATIISPTAPINIM